MTGKQKKPREGMRGRRTFARSKRNEAEGGITSHAQSNDSEESRLRATWTPSKSNDLHEQSDTHLSVMQKRLSRW